MPLQATSGAASYDAFGGGVPVVPNYIEDVFSTWLYTGNGTSQSIVNGIDLSGKGGLVWIKRRDSATNHQLADTVRGATKYIYSNLTDPQDTVSTRITSFNSDGFSLGSNVFVNNNTFPFVSWTFRKQPKFFDIVTYTGNDAANRQISHSLGSTPGCIIVKKTNESGAWYVYHRSLGNWQTDTPYTLYLNTTDSQTPTSAFKGNAPTSTTFTVDGVSGAINETGKTYVAYLFAHNAGGFGLTGTDNVISCGTYTGSGSPQTINLGYEAQFVLIKAVNTTQNWYIFENMRGMPVTGTTPYLHPNLSNAEATASAQCRATATGFIVDGDMNISADILDVEYIYIAIRRGPMKVPTVGTSVFNALSRTGTAAIATVSTTIQPDLVMSQARGGMYNVFYDRLRGAGATLSPNLGTDAESAVTNGITAFNNTSYTVGSDASQNRINWNTYTYANWLFSRAPSFMDVVCYTGSGTGALQTLNHNLTVAPELLIVKKRSADQGWRVYSSGTPTPNNYYLSLAQTIAQQDAGEAVWNTSATTFAVSAGLGLTTGGDTYVAYLFATFAGVSKVGSYTGNGSTQTINCGFTGGARFVLIKKSSGTGDWMVSDSARGIVSGNDPYLELNNTNAEVTGEDWLDTDSTGFVVNEVSGSNANTNGATYIFLAIA